MKKILIGLTSLLTAVSVLGISFLWDPNTEPDLAGYRLRWQHSPGGPLVKVIDVGMQTNFFLSATNFIFMKTNHFTVTAYNTSGLESEPSNSIMWIRSNTVPPSAVVGFRIGSITP